MKQMGKCVAWFGFLLLIVILMPGMGFSWPVPETGQTKCYDDTVEIPCPSPGEDFYGQDASYSINPMSYTKLGYGGTELPDTATFTDGWIMTRDNVTGLIWEVKQDWDSTANYDNPHDPDNKYIWYDSDPNTNGGCAGPSSDKPNTEDFITVLNTQNFGGYSNWRLPNQKELHSILDYSDRQFINKNSYSFFKALGAFYWSSITRVDLEIEAYGIDFGIRTLRSHGKWIENRVIAVRGGQSRDTDHLVSNGNGTVTDMDTGLIWQQSTSPGTLYTWKDALAYCEKLNLGGHKDWRLPTMKELESIVDFRYSRPSIDTEYFPDTQSSFYWSSNTSPSYHYAAYTVNFSFGSGGGHGGKTYYYGEEADYNYVRAVRGGYSAMQLRDFDGDGYAENQGDCNDNDATINPGAIEICGDGIDQDCDGKDMQCIESDIKANGSDGPITIMSTDNLSITIELSPGGYAGDNADWCLVEAAPSGISHYLPADGSWAPGLRNSHQGPLFNLGEFEVLNISGLPAGSYTFYFGVDLDMNGLLDMDQAYYDWVTVNIQ